METAKDRLYVKLVSNLEDLVKIYRTLLDLVRREKDYLLQADLENIQEINVAKESLIFKSKALENQRIRFARELAEVVGADADSPRLLDLASHFSGEQGDRLRNIHSALDLLVRRLTEINKENQEYAESALGVLNGAMESLREKVQGRSTYQRKGKIEKSGNKAASLVSKEA